MAPAAVSAPLTGLIGGTQYDYQVNATSSDGSSFSAVGTFTTLPKTAPIVTPTAADNITRGTARLNAAINPDSQLATYYFEYGKSAAYGSVTAVQNMAATGSPTAVSASISNLWANTDYHWRIVVTNASGTTISGDQVFTTAPSSHPGGVNQPPVGVDDFVILATAQAVHVDVLANDTDADSDPLTVISVSQPSIGRAALNADGTITYIPHATFASFAGADSFVYTLDDGQGGTASATVHIYNPFYLQKGNYAGVLSDSGASVGLLTLALAGNGSFTGKLRYGTSALALKGSFDSTGAYTGMIGGSALTLQLDLSKVTGSDYGAYTVAGTYKGLAFSCYHALYNSTSYPAPSAGLYTVLLPAKQPLSSSIPGGTGYATLKITEAGNVTITGVLADGSAISDGIFITGAGTPFSATFPVFVALAYTNRGTLIGSVAVEDVPGISDCDGALTWHKPAQAKGVYPGGFDTNVSLIGSRYAAPPAGVLALNLTPQSAPTANATVDLFETDFASTIIHAVTVAAGSTITANAVTVDDPKADSLKLSIAVKTGLFTGTLIHPIGGKSIPVKGALFHKQNLGGGFFVGPSKSGGLSLTAE